MERPGDTWGVIGLGEMGLPMALNLLRGGIRVVVHDPRREAVAAAMEAGAGEAADPRDIAAEAGVVALVVRDEEQVRAVLEGEGGLLEADVSGRLLVIHSTIGPGPCRRACEAAESAGMQVLDAPVSGMRMRAEAGTLTFLLGGSAESARRARPGLEAMGERIFELGGVGAGQTAKLANNLVSLATVMVVEEGVALAAREGLDERLVLEVLEASSGDSWIARNWEFIRHRWRGEHPLGGVGVADMVGKDLGLALSVATEAGLPAPAGALAAQLVPLIVGRGGAYDAAGVAPTTPDGGAPTARDSANVDAPLDARRI